MFEYLLVQYNKNKSFTIIEKMTDELLIKNIKQNKISEAIDIIDLYIKLKDKIVPKIVPKIKVNEILKLVDNYQNELVFLLLKKFPEEFELKIYLIII